MSDSAVVLCLGAFSLVAAGLMGAVWGLLDRIKRLEKGK